VIATAYDKRGEMMRKPVIGDRIPTDAIPATMKDLELLARKINGRNRIRLENPARLTSEDLKGPSSEISKRPKRRRKPVTLKG